MVATSFPVASVERMADARELVNQVLPVKVWLVEEAFNMVRALVKVLDAFTMMPPWKVDAVELVAMKYCADTAP